ncbi:S-adenosyl-L-methionine-dependent methyltransferase [Lactarius quietus]|nr:S-adenosyl-L-methionine-dependent methyltransferase [Lactarius quietus]
MQNLSEDTASRDDSGWSATTYRNVASYVYSSEATASVLQLLDARPGERILDFGCGSGEVTAEIARLVGPQGMVVGVDMSESMITKARQTTELLETLLIKCDIQSPQLLEEFPPDFVGKCDKIFSNAALHWCSRDPLSVLKNARKILKVGGLFVAEMGGHGNKCFECRVAQTGIRSYVKGSMVLPYSGPIYAIVEVRNLHPLNVVLQPRETPIVDLADWIRLFCGHNFLEGIDSEDEQEIIREVVASCRKAGRCRWDEEKKLWYLDYVRLRVTAVKFDD